ncbi:MAG TPA: hypothetical protein VE981_02505 [Planctomycetota bacterium]|nr:hypothetical protein [Planctomycetota bacterium]
MRILIVLGLAALLGNAGCSTNSPMLEPGVDKYKEVSPEKPDHQACCSDSACTCGKASSLEDCRRCCRDGDQVINPIP